MFNYSKFVYKRSDLRAVLLNAKNTAEAEAETQLKEIEIRKKVKKAALIPKSTPITKVAKALVRLKLDLTNDKVLKMLSKINNSKIIQIVLNKANNPETIKHVLKSVHEVTLFPAIVNLNRKDLMKIFSVGKDLKDNIEVVKFSILSNKNCPIAYFQVYKMRLPLLHKELMGNDIANTENRGMYLSLITNLHKWVLLVKNPKAPQDKVKSIVGYFKNKGEKILQIQSMTMRKQFVRTIEVFLDSKKVKNQDKKYLEDLKNKLNRPRR